jgi:CheY-like chemotaxis protein
VALDILLPGSRADGWDVLARLKGQVLTRDIPVVIVSVVDERGKGVALGAADYLVKPVGRQDLLAVLERLGLVRGGEDAAPRGAILVVEDDPLRLDQLASAIVSAGYHVLPARTGEEALRLARSTAPTLVVLDLLLRDEDGFALVEALRHIPNTSGVPIVVVTASSLAAEDKQRLGERVSCLARCSGFDRDALLAHILPLCATGREPLP